MVAAGSTPAPRSRPRALAILLSGRVTRARVLVAEMLRGVCVCVCCVFKGFKDAFFASFKERVCLRAGALMFSAQRGISLTEILRNMYLAWMTLANTACLRVWVIQYIQLCARCFLKYIFLSRPWSLARCVSAMHKRPKPFDCGAQAKASRQHS